MSSAKPEPSRSSQSARHTTRDPLTDHSPTGAEIDKIRDILFGEHARKLQAQLDRLERQLDERFAELEARIEATQGDLLARIEGARADADRSSSSALDGLRRDVDSNFAALRKAAFDRSKFSAMLTDLAQRLDAAAIDESADDDRQR